MEAALGVVILVVGLLVSIALHELGHMIPAKKFGVRVSEFFVGFGPTLWSRQRGETEYGVKAIPLGGYVRLVGMVPPEAEVKPLKVRGRVARWIDEARAVSVDEIRDGEDHRAFYRLTWWRKVIVMFGGPFVNLVIAVALFTIIFSTAGMPVTSTTVKSVVACTPATVSADCQPGDPASAAATAGLQPGDTIVGVDGLAMESWEQLVDYVSARPGQTLSMEVQRADQMFAVQVTPQPLERPVVDDRRRPILGDDGEPQMYTSGFLGVAPLGVIEPQPWGTGAEKTWEYTRLITGVVVKLPYHVYDVTLAALGQRDRDPNGIMGVVGIGRISAEIGGAQIEGYSWWEKLSDQLLLIAGLNLALFIFNMIPLVPLDGGHIVSALWQGIKNGWARMRGLARPRPVDVARMMPLAYAMFGILIVMGLVLIWADIVAPITF